VDKNNNLIPLLGYDYRCSVFDAGDHIRRIVSPEYYRFAEEIYRIYKNNNLNKIGIVNTELDIESKNLIHEKHIISYPFEWTANMYKDAVLFHLNLFLKLDRHKLTLKDALPNNIVFDFCNPVFVDFLSIVQTCNLKHETWFIKKNNYTEPRFAIFKVMFIPFMLAPLMAMAKNKYDQSRRMLSERACNCSGGIPRRQDVYPGGSLLKYGVVGKTLLKYLVKKLLLRNNELPIYSRKPFYLFRLLLSKQKSTFVDFCVQLTQFVEAADVIPPKSGYLSYYGDKGEKFDLSDRSCWQDKQKTVSKLIDSEKPDTLLDIGTNTGWFSILAAQQGIKVIATDVDESSIDALYLYSRQNHLPILPLLIPFENMTRQIFGMDCNDPEYSDRNFKATPLYLPATERLKSDMVLCLGLLHHLALGNGMSLADIIGILSKLTTKTLVLEYVDLQDRLIQGELSFFTHIDEYSANTYNIAVVMGEANRRFNSCEVVDSHPMTRKILICRK